MAILDELTEQEVSKNKAIRGYIVRALAKGSQNALLVRQITNALVADGLLTHIAQLAAVHGFQKGGAPEQRGFSGSGGPDYGDHLTLVHGEAYVPEHLVIAKLLAAAVDFEYPHLSAPPLTCSSSAASQRTTLRRPPGN